MDMRKITLIYGTLLIILGISGYFITSAVSITALIPAFFGIVVLLLGILSSKEKIRRHILHGASLLGLLGFIMTVSGLSGFIMNLGSLSEGTLTAATISKSIMSVLSLFYFLLCFKSFFDARLKRKAV